MTNEKPVTVESTNTITPSMHQHITDNETRRRLALGMISKPVNRNRRRPTVGGSSVPTMIAIGVCTALLAWIILTD